MGSFIGHVIPGSMFFVVGIWHVFSSIFSFVTKPREFRARTWHPCRLPGPLKYLELHILIFGTFVDGAIVEFLIGTHFQPFTNGAITPGRLNNFEHAAMLLLFFLFALTALVSETTSLLPLPEGALHLVVATAFTGEFLLFSFHSTSHHGLEGRYHLLLSIQIAACTLVACLLAAFPHSFLLDLAGAVAVTLQGMWFIQTAFSLYGTLVPLGCSSTDAGIHCGSEADEMRGMAIANLEFSLHLAIVILVTLATYSVISRVWGSELFWECVSSREYQAIARGGFEDGHQFEMKAPGGHEDDVPVPQSLHGAHRPNGIFWS